MLVSMARRRGSVRALAAIGPTRRSAFGRRFDSRLHHAPRRSRRGIVRQAPRPDARSRLSHPQLSYLFFNSSRSFRFINPSSRKARRCGQGLARFGQIVEHAAVLRSADSRSIQDSNRTGEGGAVYRQRNTGWPLGKPAAFAARSAAPSFAARACPVVGEQNEGNAVRLVRDRGIAGSVRGGVASEQRRRRCSGPPGRRQRSPTTAYAGE